MFRLLIATLFATLAGPTVATALETTWIGNTRDWNLSTNWSNGVPSLEDTAVFNGDYYPITIPSGGFAKSLVLTPYVTGFVAFKIGLAGQRITIGDGGGVTLTSGVVFPQRVLADVILGPDASSSEHTFSTYWQYGAPLQFEGSISGGSGGSAGAKSLVIDTGDIRFLGLVQNGGAASLALKVQNNAELRLYAANTYSGGTFVRGSSLLLENSNVIPDFGSIVLDLAYVFLNGNADSAGSLALIANSVMDFSDGAGSLFFADSHGQPWNGELLLDNFTIGEDTLRFGADSGALTAQQLALIHLPGFSASLDGEGYVVFAAVPEPSIVLLICFTASVLLFRFREKVVLSVIAGGVVLFSPDAESKVTTLSTTPQASGWNTPSNWSNGIPTIADDVKFLNIWPTPVNLGTGAFAKNIILDRPITNITLGSSPLQTLTLGNGGSIVGVNSSSRGLTIRSALVLGETAGTSEYTFKPYMWDFSRDLTVEGPVTGGAGGQAGNKAIVVDTGRLVVRGTISDGGASSVSIVIQNGATMELGAANTFSGDIKILGGELVLLNFYTDRVPDTCPITIGLGQIFSLSATETFGTLSLIDDSVLDFSRGTAHFSFADSSTFAWKGILTLFGFVPGEDTLRFGSDASGLSEEQLSRIHVFGYGAAGLDENGYVTLEPVPEPTPMGILILAAAIPLVRDVWVRRRKCTA